MCQSTERAIVVEDHSQKMRKHRGEMLTLDHKCNTYKGL